MSFKVRIIVASVCAVLAIAFMAAYALQIRGEADTKRADAIARYGGETVFAYVTTRSITRGEMFSERNVEAVEWLVDLLPEGALTNKEQFKGAYAASDIAENTPLSLVNLEQTGEQLEVPSQKVAVTVACSLVGTVGGALVPHDLVDIYVISQGSAAVLGIGIEVLKCDIRGSSQASSVTLAVDRSLVESVIAASTLQSLYLVLPAADAALQEGTVVSSRSATGSVEAVK